MEAELGEMDAEGRSERPPYAPGKKQRAKLRTGEAALEHLPTSQSTLCGRAGQLAEMLDPSLGRTLMVCASGS